MIRARFKANYPDFRPVKWPVKYPFWGSGFAADESYYIVVAYADNEDQIRELWPEAEDIESEEVENIVFTDRFPKPEWFIQ
jgi:hypothetical protein